MTITAHSLSKQISTAPQLGSADLDGPVAAGVTVLVNHRPDGEEPGQIASKVLQEAAERRGLRYVHIPVSGLPDQAAVQATREVMDSLQPGERALFFCRSGMRSTAAWAMAQRMRGVDAEELRSAAKRVGYDLDRLPL